MPKSDYFLVNRKYTKSDEWTASEFDKPRAWLDIINLANYEPRVIEIRGIAVSLKRGQLGWSMRRLAERWRWTERRTDTYLNNLQIRGRIVVQKTRLTTIITVLNYEDYQFPVEQIKEQNGGQNGVQNAAQTADREVIGSNGKEVKEPKEPKKKNTLASDEALAGFEEWYDLFNNKKSRNTAESAWKKLSKGVKAEIMDVTRDYLARRSISAKSGAFVPALPMPATYLNGRRWEDQFEIKSNGSKPEPPKMLTPEEWSEAAKRINSGSNR